VLLPDQETLVQFQPLYRCEVGSPVLGLHQGLATSWANVSILGNGTNGAHGGSGLSSIGGTIRLGELLPDAPPIRHALKLMLYARQYYWPGNATTGCFTWPAVQCDGSIHTPNATNFYNGTNPFIRPGALMAIPTVSTQTQRAEIQLKTTIGRKLFAALRDYGGYLDDNTASNSGAFNVEAGVSDEVKTAYNGTSIGSIVPGDPLYDDLLVIFQQLHVVANNGPASVGGGGRPMVPLAPPLCGVRRLQVEATDMCTMEDGVHYLGVALLPVVGLRVSSAGACCQLCQTTSGCRFFSFDRGQSCGPGELDNGCCWLKHSRLGTAHDTADIVSGFSGPRAISEIALTLQQSPVPDAGLSFPRPSLFWSAAPMTDRNLNSNNSAHWLRTVSDVVASGDEKLLELSIPAGATHLYPLSDTMSTVRVLGGWGSGMSVSWNESCCQGCKPFPACTPPHCCQANSTPATGRVACCNPVAWSDVAFKATPSGLMYRWSALYDRLDSIVNNSIRPILVLDNVDYAFVVNPSQGVYGQNMAPNNMTEYAGFIRTLLTRVIARYGRECVSSWWFRIGTEPNTDPGHWADTVQHYNEM